MSDNAKIVVKMLEDKGKWQLVNNSNVKKNEASEWLHVEGHSIDNGYFTIVPVDAMRITGGGFQQDIKECFTAEEWIVISHKVKIVYKFLKERNRQDRKLLSQSIFNKVLEKWKT